VRCGGLERRGNAGSRTQWTRLAQSAGRRPLRACLAAGPRPAIARRGRRRTVRVARPVRAVSGPRGDPRSVHQSVRRSPRTETWARLHARYGDHGAERYFNKAACVESRCTRPARDWRAVAAASRSDRASLQPRRKVAGVGVNPALTCHAADSACHGSAQSPRGTFIVRSAPRTTRKRPRPRE